MATRFTEVRDWVQNEEFFGLFGQALISSVRLKVSEWKLSRKRQNTSKIRFKNTGIAVIPFFLFELLYTYTHICIYIYNTRWIYININKHQWMYYLYMCIDNICTYINTLCRTIVPLAPPLRSMGHHRTGHRPVQIQNVNAGVQQRQNRSYALYDGTHIIMILLYKNVFICDSSYT